MIWPLYVPSKGRAATLRLPDGVQCSVVVEPHEADVYRTVIGTDVQLLVLPEPGRGIAYVRNWIKDHATKQQEPWYWMLDDDISGYYVVRGQRCVAARPADVLAQAQALSGAHAAVVQLALEYRQVAWAAGSAYALNSYCDVAVAINTQRTRGIRYRHEMELKEDRDFTLQVLVNGLLTLRSTRTAFSAPTNGSNAGGLAEVYAQEGREARAAQRMADTWPGICTVQRKSNGRIDARIDWRRFAPRSAALTHA